MCNKISLLNVSFFNANSSIVIEGTNTLFFFQKQLKKNKSSTIVIEGTSILFFKKQLKTTKRTNPHKFTHYKTMSHIFKKQS